MSLPPLTHLHPSAETMAYRRGGKHLKLWVLAIVAAATVYAWCVDFVTVEGERTIYTVACEGGSWSGNRCTGRLTPGPRFRFRALPAHGEVLFWTAGASDPAGKLAPCKVESGRNWRCDAGADSARSITLQMVRGVPQPDAVLNARGLHFVPKMRWLLLRAGMPTGARA